MPNMMLEDILDVLSSAGTVTLRRGKNDVSATPGHVPPKWSCSISLAGYNNSGHTTSILSVGGDTSMEVAQALLTRLEEYLVGEEAVVDRGRYEASYATQIALHADSKSFPPHRHPGTYYPKVKIDYTV